MISAEPAYLVLLGVVGLAAGLFLNGVIVHVPTGGSAVSRSERFAVRYALVVLSNAGLWVAAGLRFGPHLMVAPYLALFSVLLALSVIDLERYILPNRITYPSILGSLVVIPAVALTLGRPDGIVHALVGGAGYFAFLFVPALIYPRGMGFGDVKLAGLMGLYLGWIHPLLTLLSLVMASVIGLAAGLMVLVVRRGKSRPYPFGPWLAMGCVLAILFSRPLLARYGV